VAVPAERTPAGTPVGVQLVGRRWADPTVLAAAAALERRAPWSGWYDDLPLASTRFPGDGTDR
jgi:Asp-tRNA(Asn)/Glu-tRNA(Gln) amidotransferase A subunit family amidase